MTRQSHTFTPRGPSDHSVRDQIMEAAMQHFGHYGYEKTTVSDLAKAIGFSKAYIYKFFDSKQAIGEMICASRLAMIMNAVEQAVATAPSASQKLRCLFRALVETGSELFFHDRKLYNIAAVAGRDHWPSAAAHGERLHRLIEQIVLDGRKTGEFEDKTPLDETTQAISLVMQPFINPVQLQYNLDAAETAIDLLPGLLIRSLTTS